MQKGEFINHIKEINLAIYEIRNQTKLYRENLDLFVFKDQKETMFNRYVPKTNNDNIAVTIEKGAPTDSILLNIEQLPKSTSQVSFSFRPNVEFKNEIGRIGSRKVRPNSSFIIKSEQKKDQYIRIQPFLELDIKNKSKTIDVMEAICQLINQKSDLKEFNLEAVIKDDLGTSETKRIKIKSKKGGKDTTFRILDEEGEFAREIGLIRAVNSKNFEKGEDGIITINGEKKKIDDNLIHLHHGLIQIEIKDIILGETRIDFVLDGTNISNDIVKTFDRLDEFIKVFRKNKGLIRSDLLNLLNKKLKNLQDIGIDCEEELKIDEQVLISALYRDDTVNERLYHQEYGFFPFLYSFSNQIIEKPFGVFAKEEFNPYIYIHQDTNTKINRNLKKELIINKKI